MNIKFKDYIFIIYIALVPFTLSLILLRLNSIGLFTSKFYYYVILICSTISIITFVWSLLYTLDDVIYRESNIVVKNMKLALLLFFSPILIPVHYVVTYYRKYSFISIFLVSIYIFAFIYSYNTFDKYNIKLEEEYDRKNIIIKDHFNYYFDNDNFIVNIDFSYECQKDQGDYRLFCDNKKDDSFIGIYSYYIDNYSDDELINAYVFHIDQTKTYIKEAGYEFESNTIEDSVVLTYKDDMQVFLKYVEYDIDYDNNNDISLVIIYEIPKGEDNINKFNKLVESIQINDNIIS